MTPTTDSRAGAAFLPQKGNIKMFSLIIWAAVIIAGGVVWGRVIEYGKENGLIDTDGQK